MFYYSGPCGGNSLARALPVPGSQPASASAASSTAVPRASVASHTPRCGLPLLRTGTARITMHDEKRRSGWQWSWRHLGLCCWFAMGCTLWRHAFRGLCSLHHGCPAASPVEPDPPNPAPPCTHGHRSSRACAPHCPAPHCPAPHCTSPHYNTPNPSAPHRTHGRKSSSPIFSGVPLSTATALSDCRRPILTHTFRTEGLSLYLYRAHTARHGTWHGTAPHSRGVMARDTCCQSSSICVYFGGRPRGRPHSGVNMMAFALFFYQEWPFALAADVCQAYTHESRTYHTRAPD